MTRFGGILVPIAAVGAIAAPFFLKPFGIFLISTWAVLTIAAIGLNLTLGYAGQISLAQGAFVGIGAYTVALLTPAGVPFLVAFIAAIVGGFNQVRGAILGGIILGVLDNLSAAYISSQYRGAFPLIVLIIVILLRPQGLLGRIEERSV